MFVTAQIQQDSLSEHVIQSFIVANCLRGDSLWKYR